jgi:hypothetical protein
MNKKRITIKRALEELARWRAEYSVERAVGAMAQWYERPTFFVLYQHYFPAEYAASQASAQARPEDGLSRREIEFLNLVAQRLFPLEPDWVVEQAMEKYGEGEDLLLCIPIEEIVPRPDEWDEERQPLVNVFAEMVGYTNIEFDKVRAHFAELGVNLPFPLAPKGGQMESVWARFQTLCASKGRPLSGVPQMMDLLFHNTGNFWLDFDPELVYASEAMEWTVENMDWFATEWRAAEPILDVGTETLNWLAKHPELLVDVIECWNLALQAPMTGGDRDATKTTATQ